MKPSPSATQDKTTQLEGSLKEDGARLVLGWLNITNSGREPSPDTELVVSLDKEKYELVQPARCIGENTLFCSIPVGKV